MRSRSPHQPNRSEDADDTLALLLTSEEAAAARVASARAEAEALLREAQEQARLADATCAATIESRLAALVTEHEAGLASDLAVIRRDAALTVAAFDAVDAERTRAHVAFVIARLLSDGSPRTG